MTYLQGEGLMLIQSHGGGGGDATLVECLCLFSLTPLEGHRQQGRGPTPVVLACRTFRLKLKLTDILRPRLFGTQRGWSEGSGDPLPGGGGGVAAPAPPAPPPRDRHQGQDPPPDWHQDPPPGCHPDSPPGPQQGCPAQSGRSPAPVPPPRPVGAPRCLPAGPAIKNKKTSSNTFANPRFWTYMPPA